MPQGARAGSQSRAAQNRERAIELIKKGLPSSIIAQRLGMRAGTVGQLRKEIENKDREIV